MHVRLAAGAPLQHSCDALVVPLFRGETPTGEVAALDAAVGGAIAAALAAGEIAGKLGETVYIAAPTQPFRRVLAIALGERASFEPYLLARYAGIAVRYLGRRNLKHIAVLLPDALDANPAADASFVAEGAIAGAFETSVYQKQPEKRIAVEVVDLLAGDRDRAALTRGLDRGIALGEAVNLARTLAITPANDMTPTHLAAAAERVAQAGGLSIDVLDEARARAEGMGSFLSVAAGSAQPPKLIVLTYTGDPASSERLALVGKGITFDTGGISLKPPERMEEMKYDMSGGAAVIAAMSAVAALKPKINVIGVVPATENMPGGKATKPGDIVTAMNGKTIEVINTDAEGRLILADALCYARKLGATRIVDAATLTGACVIALGHAASAAVSNDDAWAERFLNAAKPTGERYWRMPAYDDYATAMKSDIADLKNTGGRPAGTLTAAAFLKAFVDDTPWVHLDVAGTAYTDTETAWQAKGPTGTPVRAFVALVESVAGSPIVHANGATSVAAS